MSDIPARQSPARDLRGRAFVSERVEKGKAAFHPAPQRIEDAGSLIVSHLGV